MKKLFIPLLFCLACVQASAQKVTGKEIKNSDIVYLLNNIEARYTLTASISLGINAYIVADPSGSAHTEGTDEITNSIYIATSEDGEEPEQHLFRLSSVYAPKFVKWIKGPKPQFIFTYGPYKHRHTATVTVSLKNISIAER